MEECIAFNSLALSKAIHTQIIRLQQQALQLNDHLDVIESNAHIARNSVGQCANDATGITGAYVTNANSMVKVQTCQRLIAEELRRIAEECLKAKAQIWIPWYGLIKYYNHVCLTTTEVLVGVATTAISTLVALKLLSCVCCPSRPRAVHHARHKKKAEEWSTESSSESESESESVSESESSDSSEEERRKRKARKKHRRHARP